jgi:hypothetical protein
MAAIHTVAVIGAGVMGRGIAHAAALAGYRTILEDILPETLRRAGDEIRGALDQAVAAGKLSPEQAQAAFTRLEYAHSVEEAARQAEFVIEAVPEEMESKIEIFTMLDKICRPETFLGSNTSSLSVTEIASVTYRAHRIAGMHFFHPVHKMKLLEIVRGLETDDQTIAAAVEIGTRMGKEVVVVRESPGFITSRINALIGNEASGGRGLGQRHRQGDQAGPQSSHRPLRDGRSGWTRHPPAHPGIPAQNPGREVSPLSSDGAIRQSRTSRPQIRTRRIRLSRAQRRAKGSPTCAVVAQDGVKMRVG